MDIDRVSDAIGLAAGVGGVLLIAATWPRHRRHAARRQHPSAGAPFALWLASADGPWLVAVREGRPPVTIDILTHRPTGSTDEWNSEEIIEPVAVAPGETVQIPSNVAHLPGEHDVVVGWTVQHTTGDVQGSRAMRVGEQPTVVVATQPSDPGVGFTMAYGLIATFLVFASMVIGLRLVDDSRFRHEPSLAVLDPVDSSTSTSVPATVATTSVPVKTTPMSSAQPITTPATTTPATTTPATTTPATTTPATTTTTTSTTTTSTTTPSSTTTTSSTTSTTTTVAAVAPTSTVPFSREVAIEARIAPCRFGPACLIAGFTLVGFTGSGEYVCDFADFDRFAFPYSGTGRADACAAASESTTITIEVDGVRSKTVSRKSLDGN